MPSLCVFSKQDDALVGWSDAISADHALRGTVAALRRAGSFGVFDLERRWLLSLSGARSTCQRSSGVEQRFRNSRLGVLKGGFSFKTVLSRFGSQS